MPKSKAFLLSATSLCLVISACAGDAKSAATTTTIHRTVLTVPTLPSTVPTDTAAPAVVVTVPTLPAPVESTTTLPATQSSTSSSTSSTTKDYEVVGGIFTTKAAAQSQIKKLTAAKFTGFSIKVVGAKFAAVLPGLTQAKATALAAKINKAGTAKATTFHLTSSSTATPTTTVPSTSTNFEVVDGIYTTKTAAQAQIDKLTKAKFAGFTIKVIPGKFAVVKAGLTNAEASALVTKINAANLGPSRVKAL